MEEHGVRRNIELTRKAIGTVSRTATLARGIEKTLAPAGSMSLEGAGVPHW